MPKFTYPVVFILNQGTDEYFGFIPDLGLLSVGGKLEEVYALAEEKIQEYFALAIKHDLDYPSASTLEEIIAKWAGYKVSLLTANVPDQG